LQEERSRSSRSCRPSLAHDRIVLFLCVLAIAAPNESLAQAGSNTQGLSAGSTLHVSGTLTVGNSTSHSHHPTVKPSPCATYKDQKSCATAVDASAQLKAGEMFLGFGQYSRAKTSCESAFATTLDSLEENKAKTCLEEAVVAIHDQQRIEINAALAKIDSCRSRKEFDKADSLTADLRKRYADAPTELDGPREYLESQLLLRSPQSSDFLAPAFEKLDPVIAYAIALVCLLLFILLIALILRKVFQWCSATIRAVDNKILWRVWSVADGDNCGAAGAVMEALKLDNNVLLRDHYRGEFEASSLLLSPLPRRIGGEEFPDIWWNFIHDRSVLCGIERLPIDEMKRHSFALEEAFDEIDLKVAGAEIKGVVGILRSLKRWFFKGFPALQAYAGRSGADDHANANIRLTCIYKRSWLDRQRGPKSANSGHEDTISVLASTEIQRFADPVSLAAHRAAFKLFYRLAQPSTHPDQVTAIASFHQGVALLLLLL